MKKVTLKDFKQALVQQMAEADGRPVPAPGDCPLCGAKPPFTFKDALSVKEHGITGACQACQDKVESYGEDPEA